MNLISKSKHPNDYSADVGVDVSNAHMLIKDAARN